MKQNLKNYLKLGILLFGVSIILVNCQQDDDLKSIQEKNLANSNKKLLPNGMTLQNISRSGIKSPRVLCILDSIKQQKHVKTQTRNALNKTITNDSLQISINDEYISYIESEDGTYHSYTFPAFDHEHPEGLKNLLISLQPDGNYKEMVVSYNLTEGELDLLNSGMNIDLTDKVTYYPLEDNIFSNNMFSKTYYNADDCMTHQYAPARCCENNHTYEQIQSGEFNCYCSEDSQPGPFEYTLVLNFGTCPSSGGGNNSDNGDNTNNTNDTNTNEDNTPPDGNNTPNGTSTGGDTNVTTPTDCKGPDCPEEFVEKPCSGDPVHNPQVAPQNGKSGTKGALFGCTRYGGSCTSTDGRNKKHNGIDIKNEYGKPVYAMYSGFIYSTKHDPGGAGYYTRVQSTVNGETFLIEYFHLQKDNRILQTSNPLTYVSAGDIIGYQGDSGNLKGAIAAGGVDSHVHIEVREHDGSNQWGYDNFEPVDPRDYLSTTIDDEGETEENIDCN